MRMMNSGTTSLDRILCMGTTSKARESINYQEGSLDSKTAVQKKHSHINFAKIKEIV